MFVRSSTCKPMLFFFLAVLYSNTGKGEIHFTALGRFPSPARRGSVPGMRNGGGFLPFSGLHYPWAFPGPYRFTATGPDFPLLFLHSLAQGLSVMTRVFFVHLPCRPEVLENYSSLLSPLSCPQPKTQRVGVETRQPSHTSGGSVCSTLVPTFSRMIKFQLPSVAAFSSQTPFLIPLLGFPGTTSQENHLH